MLILGEISGIQGFVYDVSHQSGGQARRLRARSFYVQALSEAAAIVLLDRLTKVLPTGAVAWTFDLSEHLLVSAAGRFLLRGPDIQDPSTFVREIERELSRWLLQNLSAELRVSLAVTKGEGTEVEQFSRLRTQELDQSRLRPWSTLAIANGRWQPNELILPPLDTPCVICRKRTGSVTETDSDTNEQRLVCGSCHQQLEFGKDLPNAKWLMFCSPPRQHDLTAFGLAVRTSDAAAVNPNDPDLVALANLTDPLNLPGTLPRGRGLHRRLARATPVQEVKDQAKNRVRQVAATFEHLADKAKGAPFLGVLKADGDGLGAYLGAMFPGWADLTEYQKLSRELDAFSAGDMDQLLRKEFPLVYTIYSGGDDLLLIGPWDQMFKVARQANELFTQRMAGRPVTLSAGLAIISRRWPIRRAVVAAEELLDLAKTSTVNGTPKDQMAALGMVWKWSDYEEVMCNAWQLTDWVEAKVCERGWLQTLLDLCEATRSPVTDEMSTRERRQGPLAGAHWNYFVTRNVKANDRPRNEFEASRLVFRQWLDGLGLELDAPQSVTSRYLPAIIRFAMLATRSKSEKE